MIKKLHWLGLLVFTLAACTVPSVAPATAPAATTSTVRVIKHALGETAITGTPQRVVALEWTYVEDVLALGIQPVGVADIAGYNDWVKTPIALAPDVVDVGVRGEPNLETLVGLQPDLIIASADIAPGTYDTLRELAPTLVFDPYPVDDSINHYDEMVSTFRTLADVLGRVAEGEAVLAHLDQKFVDARAVLEANGKVGEKFVLSQAWSGESAVDIRLFTAKAMSTQIIMRIGLDVGLDEGWYDDWQQYGFALVSPEKLPELGDLNYFYVVQDSDDVFAAAAMQPLWQQLEFVKQGHAYPLGGDTWLFGGPLSAELLVDIVVEALVPGAVIGETAPVTTSADAATTETATHVIEHALGTTEITGTPQRIVALEWKYAEDLLALGLQPVGVADIAGYTEWVKIPVALSPDVVDVGTRQAPNLELLASLQPDLILTASNRVGESYAQLSAIAPTLVFSPYPTDETVSPYAEMRNVLLLIADLTDRHSAGEAALARLDQKFADARATLESAGLLGEKFILAQGFTSDNAATVRLFIENAMAIQIIEQIGLELGWNSGWQQYGFSTVSVEELPQLGDLHFFYVVQEDDNIFASAAVKPLWDQIEFVKHDHAYPLGGGTWLFGGALSAEVLVDIVIKALVPAAAVAQ